MDTQPTTYTPERVDEKKNKQTRTWVSFKCKKGEFLTLLCSSPCICRLSRVCIWAKIPQSHKGSWLMFSRWPTRQLSQQVLAAAFLDRQLPPTSIDCFVLLTGLFYPLLLTDSFSVLPGTLLPLPSSGLVGYLARKPSVWVSRQKRQRNLLTGTPTGMNATYCVTVQLPINFIHL